ncbi:amidohydrolase family protein [Actinomadura sp. HBU206391]|uniref:amidohydrolase family protein n=1 Tax=Actinomadura sp. HBU206391 TaxID=2731692 RepID=UPI00165059A4|nr:amidohydrolase family protein [Actinomadura sp. HBU206391]MBC6460729.1 amidohydrolase family protein [Actinomadura sp. HBU206391]
MTGIDVHQHLWTDSFLAALRARSEPPFLSGWTLHLENESPFDVDPADHDIGLRTELVRADDLDRALVSLSTPLGVEWLPPHEANPLLDAYHDGAAALPEPFGAWAAACVREIDTDATAERLDQGFAGLQLPATALADAAGHDRCAPLLDLLEERDLPLLVHPGPVPEAVTDPGWWPALVPYVQQMHAAWFAFRAFGRSRHPRLRVCFALLAGLAPLHGERLAARGGGRGEVDPLSFVETSSYGPRGVDAVVRAIGVDVIAYGSDRPYAGPPERADFNLGEAGGRALRVANPHRLLTGRE